MADKTACPPVTVKAVANRPAAEPPQIDSDDSDDFVPDKLPYSTLRCIALVATVTGASFSNTLSVQAVVIALPSISRDLDVPNSRQQWIISAYSLTFGCFLLLWGRIADVLGKKAIFVAGSAWVTVMTAINPVLTNEIAFDLFRGLQGIGAAANVPTALGILGTTFPPGKAKNYAFAAYGAGAPLGSVFGNLVSGLITSYAHWKWVFGVLAILSGVVTVAGQLLLPAHPPGMAPTGPRPAGATWAAFARVDWLGGVMVTLGLVGLLFALTEGNVVGWSTPWVGVIIGLSVLLVVAFGYYQRWLETPGCAQRQQAGAVWPPPPLVRMSIFSHAQGGSFRVALVIMAFFFSSFNGYLVYSTYFYQDYQGLSAIQTTLRFIPTGVAGVLTCFCVAPLLSRVPTCWLLLFGNAAVSISSLLMAAPIPPSTSYFAYGLPAMVLSVLGADTAWPSLTLYASRALPPADQALGGALINAASQVGRAIGLAIATAVQTAVMAHARGRSVREVGPTVPHDHATLQGLRASNWFHFALGVTSFLVVGVAFRGAGTVGKVPSRVQPPLRSTSDPVPPVVDLEEGRDTETRVPQEKNN